MLQTGKKYKSLLLLTFMLTSCNTSLPTGNPGKPETSIKSSFLANNKFSLKSVGAGITENTSTEIKYSGVWSVDPDAGASGSSISSTAGSVVDNGDPNNAANPIKYLGNKWNLISDSTATSGGYAYNTGINNQVEQTNADIKYTTLPSIIKWFNAAGGSVITNPLDGNIYNYNDSKTVPINPPVPVPAPAANTQTAMVTPVTSSSGVVLTGTGWMYQSNTTSFNQGYVYNTGSSGWSLEYTFKGTNTELKGFKGNNRGKIRVTVINTDTNTPERDFDVDLYSSISVVNATLAKISGLKMGNHKIKVEPKGTKNSSSSDYRYDFITGFSYGSAEYEFKGDRTAYLAYKYSKGGRADVSLDITPDTVTADELANITDIAHVTLYSASNTAGVIAKDYNGLPQGKKRLVVEGTGSRDSVASANNVTIDAIEVRPSIKGSFTGAAAGLIMRKDSASGSAEIYIDDVYHSTVDLNSGTAGFTTVPISGLSTGSHTFEIVGKPNGSNTALGFDGIQSSIASLDFNGYTIKYIASKGPDQGIAEIFIDGVSLGLVDLYAAAGTSQKMVFRKSGLSESVGHTITILPTGTKNPASSGASINIDAFKVFDYIGEFPVNTTTVGAQSNPAVAMDNDGDYVVTWSDGYWNEDGQDGSSYGIYAQRYNNDGFKIGTEFPVNSTTNGDQSNPAIAMDGNGNFIIVWNSFNQDGDSKGIFAQRYYSDGTVNGPEFPVNTTTIGSQYNPAVAMNSAGDFTISWSNDYTGIYAQSYHSDGTVNVPEFHVNSSYGDQSSVAMDTAGDFVVSWQGSSGIYVKSYYSDGSVNLTESLVNSHLTISGSVAMDNDGDFVVAWSNVYWGIYAQSYNRYGAVTVPEFEVYPRFTQETYNNYSGNWLAPSVAMDSSGDFVVSFTSAADQDGSAYGISAKRYNSDGTMIGTQIQINTSTENLQFQPSAAMDSEGDFVITWSDNDWYGNPTHDGDSYGIFGRRYDSDGIPQ
jgi:hypothetical protein